MGRIAIRVVGLTAVLAMTACDVGADKAVPQPLAEPPQLDSEQQKPGGQSATQQVVAVAENEVIVARFKEDIDAMARDAEFEEEGRSHAQELFPGSRVESICCGDSACYLTIVAASPRELLEIRPEGLNWGRLRMWFPTTPNSLCSRCSRAGNTRSLRSTSPHRTLCRSCPWLNTSGQLASWFALNWDHCER